MSYRSLIEFALQVFGRVCLTGLWETLFYRSLREFALQYTFPIEVRRASLPVHLNIILSCVLKPLFLARISMSVVVFEVGLSYLCQAMNKCGLRPGQEMSLPLLLSTPLIVFSCLTHFAAGNALTYTL